MKQAANINEVLEQLDTIIRWCKQQNSRIGYFAVLYKQMTMAVKNGILNNSFDDGARMELLDVIFANRYISAWQAYTSERPCSASWCTAFDACRNTRLIVLQHLILGINTHINLDLGIAAAECSKPGKIQNLKNDFNKINDVISALSNQIQEKLSSIWFPLRFLEKIANNREDAVLNFSIATARKTAWANAVILSGLSAAEKTGHISSMDNTVNRIAARINKPGIGISLMLKPVLVMEDKNISNIITLLEKDNTASKMLK